MLNEHAAANLPAGSIIGTDKTALFRAFDGFGYVWRSTEKSRRHNDEEVDQMLAGGAVVLRHGYGQEADL